MPASLVSRGKPGFYFRVLEEGEVEAGDVIVQVVADPGLMTVATVNALVYGASHQSSELEEVLRIAALAGGILSGALLDSAKTGEPLSGNPGLEPAAGRPPAWTGFRPLLVSRKSRESSSAFSLTLEPTDGRPLQVALFGQYSTSHPA